MNSVIKIYSYKIEQQLSENEFQALSQHLPAKTQLKISQYRRWQDRHAMLWGRLLLKTALIREDYPLMCLDNLLLDAYNRPFIDLNVDFNISHSGDYVLCAITKKGRIGIDIEHIRRINIEDFKAFLSNEEWFDVIEAKDTIKRFYHYWTVKESVMKADGRGLNIPPRSIVSYFDHAMLDDKKWGLKKIDIDDHYSCHLAFEQYEAFYLSSVKYDATSYNLSDSVWFPIRIIEICA